MFTGIVQGLGEIKSLERKASEIRMSIVPHFSMENIIDGESIAVDGVCLSVEKHTGNTFFVYVSAQTLDHSNLGELKISSLVNLERALTFGESVGGHLVSGHIDCVAIVKEIKKEAESRKVLVTFPEAYSDLVIDRGSITLNGISLTVTSCGKGFLAVNIIPDSQKRTNMPAWRYGTPLNMETDLIGKYVVNFARDWFKDKEGGKKVSALSREFLGRYGFL